MVESDRAINEIEVERLRELALEQQEVIEILRQAVKVDMRVEQLNIFRTFRRCSKCMQ